MRLKGLLCRRKRLLGVSKRVVDVAAAFWVSKSASLASKTRFVQVTWRYVSNAEIFVSEAGSAIFGLLRQFPIEWCKSRLCMLHLARFWAKTRFHIGKAMIFKHQCILP